MMGPHSTFRNLSLTLPILFLLLPPAAYAGKEFSVAAAVSNPRGEFAAGWHPGMGLESTLQWPYWRSVDASVSLSLLNHLPKRSEDPEVLLGVWTLGVHWKPQLTPSTALDFIFGAEHHTALFHTGWDTYVGTKGYNESDLGACFGAGIARRLSDRWKLQLGVKTHTIFTRPEWVHYETVGVGLAYAQPH
jgi:hypothetical protein